MDLKEPFLWMGGLLATQIDLESTDPADLDRIQSGLWAVINNFEGGFRFVHFTKVERVSKPPNLPAWRKLAGRWSTSLDQNAYQNGVSNIREAISRGDVYQVNLCRVLSHPISNDQSILGLATELASANPAPHAVVISLPEVEIVSASPELFIKRYGDELMSSPIKGTGKNEAEILEKDKAENIMIVDLVRHDLSQICEMGSIHVPRLMEVEQHPGLVHLVSDVSGKLLPNISWAEIFTAISPPGSVSGAPKIAALEIIKELEPVERGPYCGGIGWIMGDKSEIAVGIRTFWRDFKSNQIYFGTGAGITWGSDPLKEWNETVLKADRLIQIAGGQM
ncbi:MAG: anthranilate synthase component I family protein [Actinobacteria bacterium]|nr:anthranilate synthase component I family protein [Actinomycetota bacterium]MSY05386.1 anthranilate synthase component I family protein [Actinomycetota bacterium]MSY67148.1 anthranilate synthase component I family protein [Actinomycetota bacterium]MTA00931.1 anthranilate synthase component I family protein [Actinomycetota bacterium]